MLLIIEIAAGIVLGKAVWWIITHWSDLPTISMVLFWERHPILATVAYALIYVIIIGIFGGVALFFLHLADPTWHPF